MEAEAYILRGHWAMYKFYLLIYMTGCTMLSLLTLLLIEDNVSKQEIIVAEHDRRSQVRQNSVQQINFVFQLVTIQRQLLKAGQRTAKNTSYCAVEKVLQPEIKVHAHTQ